MEELMLSNIFTIIVAIAGLASTYLGIYYKLKSSFDNQIKEAVEKEIKELKAKHELRLQALEISSKNFSNEQVRKEDLIEVRVGLKAITIRFDDLRDLIKSLK